MQMKESETVSEFFSKVSTITNQIISYGDTLEDKKIVMKVLRSLPAKFEHVVAAIEVSKDLATLTLDELMGALEAHQERIQRFANQPMDQAFQAKMNISDKREASHQDGNKRSSYNNQSSNRGRNQNWRTRGRGKRCKIPNHSQKDCWFQNRDQANFSEQDGDAQNTGWYIDSACSNHMSGIRELFAELDESQKSEVKIGDGKTLKIEGRGVIVFHSNEGKPQKITDVYYVPELTQNLLSTGQLMKKGFSLTFDAEQCIIFDKKKI
nr:PREDICTED: uncharacterized protein LOC108201187 [Daucus carota subsp. sativus]